MKKEEFKELPALQKIRVLSGVVSPDVDELMSRLAIICLIVRVELKDADQDFLDTQIDKMFGG